MTSIIIPTSAGCRMLAPCLASIRDHTAVPHDIIVVDNGPPDGTLALCVRERVKLLSIPEPVGFPAACNRGLNLASGDAVLFLNNDTIVGPNWLGNLLRCLDSAPDIGLVGPLANYASGGQFSGRDYASASDYLRMAAEWNRPDPGRWRETQRLVGFCLLMKREVPERIGGFDERFSPGHYEDDDYVHRAKLAGYRLMIAGDTHIHHSGSATFESERQQRILKTNRRKFMEKWGFDPWIYANP